MQTTSQDDKTFLTELLLQQEAPHLVFKTLFDQRKTQQSNFSIGFICRESGIPSRGYLSEFLNGKRALHEKYWKPLLRCFKLKGRPADLVLNFFALTQATDPELRLLIEKRIASLRRAIRNDSGTMPRKLQGLFFAFEVFCAFGLFANAPSRNDLKKYFGREFALEVDFALNALLALDLVSHNSEDDRFSLKETAIRFSDSDDDGLSHYNYLRYAVQDAEANMKKWHKSPDAFFESSIISVRKTDYQSFLQNYFDEHLVAVRDLESSDADTLIRFNIQIYPVR